MFIFFLLLSLPLFSANDVSLYSNNETYMRRTDADFRTALPFNVNPITGEYCEVQTDLVVSGVQPISYRRFYGHFCDGDLANGHWSVNPESLVLFSLCSSEIEPFVGHGTADGGFYRFEHWKKNDRIELLDAKSYVHREISGGRHPANTVVEWDRSSPEPYFIFSGEIKRGDGTKISYESEYKAWPAIEVDPIARAMQTRLPPPFMAKVKRERLPNGNYLFYQYLDYAHNHTSDPAYYVLSHIVAVDSSMRVKLGEISIKYPKRMGPKNNHISKQVVISGSDGRIASYELELRTVIEKNSKRKHPYIFDLLLSSVERPDGADQSYQYGWKNKKGLKPQKKLAHYKKYALLERSVTEDGMPIRIEYGAGRRVERIYGPGDMIVASYVYGHGYTVVTDGAGNHTIYRYDKNKRVYEVETADAIHKSKWSELGDLLSKSICDKGGCELSKTTYKYDVHHNRIEESFAGTTIFREFDDNNRIIERREGAKRTIYEYEDNRDLITYEALFDGAKELSWTKNRYDYAACLIRTEHFDGKHRRIKKIQPRRTLPNYGLPEVVEEFDEEESLIQKRVYLYTPAGKISSERHYDAHGSLCYTISNEYDEKENLILTIDAEGNETRYSYDDRGNQIEKVLGNQQIITIYDAANRPIEVHDGDLVTYKSYNPAGQLISMTKPSGYKELYSYDASGRLFRTDYADGTFESLEYDPLGNVVKRRDRNGFVTSTEYNERSLPVEVKHPDGGCESFVYDEYGRLISSTDRHGMETTYSYNICDQLISKSQGDRRYHAVYEGPLLIEEEEFSGIKSSYVYNILGQKVEETKGGRRAFFYYDARGRLSHRVAGDSVYVFEYDNLDRVVRKKRVAHDRAWNEVSYRFDECGRLIWEESSRGIFERFYNGQGQLIMEVDQLGQCTESSYRNGLLVAKRLPSGVTTHMEYDSCDRVSLIYKTDPSGRKCSMTKKAYDGRGNCVRREDSIYVNGRSRGAVCHEYGYGPGDRVEWLLEAGRRRTSRSYDKMGRLQRVELPSGDLHHYEYDEFGRVSRYRGADFDYNYSYDAADNMTLVEDRCLGMKTKRSFNVHGEMVEECLGNGACFRSSYNSDGQRTKLILPDKSEVTYTYMGAYLKSVTRNGQKHIYERAEDGLITGCHLMHGFGRLEIERDALGRPLHISAPSLDLRYSYDASGNVLSENSRRYRYDSLDQLIEEDKKHYCHDSLSNRLSADYEVDELGQLSSYEYDANGNMLLHGFVYDSQNRLVGVPSAQYGYDNFHRRLWKNVKGAKSYFLWDGQNEIGRFTPKKHDYCIHNELVINELRILGEGLGAEIGAAVLIERGDKVFVPLHDHRGSVRTLLNSKKRQSFDYDAFGVGDTDGSWRFCSKRSDPETGLIYFGRRYYIPELGRWLTPDPEGYHDGPNRYGYVHGNPHHIDLYGLADQSLLSRMWGYTPAGYMTKQLMSRVPESWVNPQVGGVTDLRSMGYPVKEMPPGRSFLYHNGMRNSDAVRTQNALHLSRLSGGYNVHMIENKSSGLRDFARVVLERVGGREFSQVGVAKGAMEGLLSSAGSTLMYIPHSEGAMQGKAALQRLPDDLRNRITTAAFAPATPITRNLCHSATNYVAKPHRDPIPWIGGAGLWENRGSVTVLDSHPSVRGFDHSITSPTFEKRLEDDMFDYLSRGIK